MTSAGPDAGQPPLTPVVRVPPPPPVLPLRPGWPLTVLLGGFPLFWALGLSNFAVTLMAIPMAFELMRRRPIKLPRGFALWALFLVWSASSALLLGVDPPGTIPGSAQSRLFGFAFRELGFVSVTVVLLYVGNLREVEFPQLKLVRLLGWFFLWVVGGGLLGLLAPEFEFTSVAELVLPSSITNNLYARTLLHPAAAQIQDVIAVGTPRPAAPFGYTNTWGFHMTVLGVWFFAGWFVGRRSGERLLAGGVLAVGAVVLIYSLNRGAWIGVGIAVALAVLRLARYQRLLPLVTTLLVTAVATLVFVASPLLGLVQARLDDGVSNDIRSFTTERALELSRQSPVIGYGSTRAAVGSSSSIAIGKSADCPQCGNISIGINGYFFMLLMSTGWVGAALFYGFGVVQVWRARGDPRPHVTAAIVVIVLTGYYGLTYDIANWMIVPFLSLAVLWRADREQQEAKVMT